jgi:hypothetical protein
MVFSPIACIGNITGTHSVNLAIVGESSAVMQKKKSLDLPMVAMLKLGAVNSWLSAELPGELPAELLIERP